MNRFFIRFFIKSVLFLLFYSIAIVSWAAPQLTDEKSISAVISAMTLGEKAAFVVGTGMNRVEKVPGAMGSTLAIPRLGIPQIVFADGTIGPKLGGWKNIKEKRFATGFPAFVAIGATWDPALMKRVAGAVGEQAQQYGIDVILGPTINIHRNALNGRNYEYLSEDPFLISRLAIEYIKGLQGKNIGAVLKHFAAHNQETRAQEMNAIISERALHEIYLAAFQNTLEEVQPWAVMTAYPAINGVLASQNPFLLTDLLRKKWGFTGIVMSDWYGIADPVQALLAGNDLNMPGGTKDSLRSATVQDPGDRILAALESGELSHSQIDDHIRKILALILKTNRFNNQDRRDWPQGSIESDYSALAREVAADSMVLLKNDKQTLPVKAPLRIATFGRNIENFYVNGGGGIDINIHPNRLVTLQRGLQNAGMTLIHQIEGSILDETVTADRIARAAQESDMALISIGRISTVRIDHYSMRTHPDEVNMIKKVAEAFHRLNKKVVVLLNVGSPIEVHSWDKDVDAILLVWKPGEQGGNAIADILTGKINPSGKLPVTFPVHRVDTPSFGNFPGSEKNVIYGEGIYVGYRYFDTKHIAPAYPFGHGLSYSMVHYGAVRPKNLVFNSDSQESVRLAISLYNPSSIPHKEVVQLYVHDHSSRLDRPEQELKAFAKVSLMAGEEKEVTLTLDRRSLSYYDPEKKDWVLESGPFTLRIGRSSRDILLEVPLIVTSSQPKFTLQTPWMDILTYENAANIVAQFLGDEQTRLWTQGDPTLDEKLEEALKMREEFKNDASIRDKIKLQLLQKINEL